jgi:very-short-patch-repair endonuclease
MVKLSGRDNFPFYFGAGTDLLKLAADLRKTMTPEEKVLWEKLRNRQVRNYRFRRQHPIKDFIVDFFCYDAMLVIEVDGNVHDLYTQNERDKQRTKILESLGIREIRFRNDEVINDIQNVLSRIEAVLVND